MYWCLSELLQECLYCDSTSRLVTLPSFLIHVALFLQQCPHRLYSQPIQRWSEQLKWKRMPIKEKEATTMTTDHNFHRMRLVCISPSIFALSNFEWRGEMEWLAMHVCGTFHGSRNGHPRKLNRENFEDWPSGKIGPLENFLLYINILQSFW